MLRFKSKTIQIGQELMEVLLMFFYSISLISMISTKERFMKRLSNHHDCMGCIYCGMDRGLGLCQKPLGNGHQLMKILRFSITISPILLILRILTDQRLRKEWSVQDAYMGLIVDQIEPLNCVTRDWETDND